MPKLRAPRKIDPAFIVGDVVVIAHFFVALIVMIIGETTPLMNSMREKHPGVMFLYRYLDKPVYDAISPWFSWLREFHDLKTFYLGALFVNVVSSVFYGVVVYVVVKIFLIIFSVKDIRR